MPSIDDVVKRLSVKGIRVQKVLSRKELIQKIAKTYLSSTKTLTSDIK